MELEELVKIFNENLDGDNSQALTETDSFKDHPMWSSLSAFSISVAIYEKFGIRLKGIQIRKCETIKDLFDVLSAQ